MNLKSFIRPGKRGASDITPLLQSTEAFSEAINRMSNLFEGIRVDKIACIEARGFVFGGALAHKLQVGVILLRAHGKLQNDVFSQTFKDYTGREKILEMQTDAIKEGEKVLLVDDWLETGGAMHAAIHLIEKGGGEVAGIAVLIDDSTDEVKRSFTNYNYKFVERVLPEDKF